MKHSINRTLIFCIATLSLLLSGCAAVVRSNVTAFNEWPTDLTDKSYVFVHTPAQTNDLEYRNYENLVSIELQRLGFVQTTAGVRSHLEVAINYGITARDVHTLTPVVIDPGWYGTPFYGPGWWSRSPFYGPYYDPFWHYPPIVGQQESIYQLFTRRLNITITRTNNAKKLYDVTVTSEGKINALSAIMPYLVRSAFIDFPGKSGVPRRVELKVTEK